MEEGLSLNEGGLGRRILKESQRVAIGVKSIKKWLLRSS